MDFAKKGMKPTAAQKKQIQEQMTIEANEYQKAKAAASKKKAPADKAGEGYIPAEDVEGVKPKDGHKFQKVLGKKKTIKDTAGGGDWEVTEKRDTLVVERPIDTDSDFGSELSYD